MPISPVVALPSEVTAAATAVLRALLATAAAGGGGAAAAPPGDNVTLLGVAFTAGGWPAPARRLQSAAASDQLVLTAGIAVWSSAGAAAVAAQLT